MPSWKVPVNAKTNTDTTWLNHWNPHSSHNLHSHFLTSTLATTTPFLSLSLGGRSSYAAGGVGTALQSLQFYSRLRNLAASEVPTAWLDPAVSSSLSLVSRRTASDRQTTYSHGELVSCSAAWTLAGENVVTKWRMTEYSAARGDIIFLLNLIEIGCRAQCWKRE